MTEQETVKTEEVAKVNPLERTLDLVVSYASAEELTEKALKNYGKNAKLPGFRKGHVPAAQVRRMYGMQAYDEAINQLVGEAWQKAASESELRIAGYPRIDAAKNEEDKENMHFTAKFEVFPDVQVPDFSAVELKRYVCPVTDAEVEKTIDVMRRQRATYNPPLTTTASSSTSRARRTALNSRAVPPKATCSFSARAACSPSSKPPSRAWLPVKRRPSR